MGIKKFPDVNIINFENVDKPEGGGGSRIYIRYCHAMRVTEGL